MPETVTYKTTLIFEGRAHGWTESYWIQDSVENYDLQMNRLEFMAKTRAGLLGSDCFIKALRVSRQDENGDGFLKYVNFAGDADHPSAEQDVGVLLRLQNAGRKKKKFVFLRGIWDAVETNHGAYQPNVAPWGKRMNAFILELTSSQRQWGWWGVDTKTEALMTGYTVDALNRLTFTFATNLFPAPRFGKRDHVRLTGVNGKSRLNGVQVVDVVDAKNAISFLPLASVPYSFGGKGTYSTYNFFRFGFGEDQRITRRAAGSPLLDTAGAPKKRPRV